MRLINRLPALLVAALMALPAAPLFIAGAAHAQAPAQPAAQPSGDQPAGDAAKAAAPAPTPTPPAGAGQGPTTEKEVIDNPYGLEAMWKQGDFVSKGTLIILVIM